MSHNILFPIDLEHESSWKPVLPIAVELARARAATLHVMEVVPQIKGAPGLPASRDFGESVPSLEDYNRKLKEAAAREVEQFVREHVPADVETKHFVSVGSIYRQILEAANAVHADLIVMSAYRPSLRSFLLGTTAERVARHADCSVYIVRP